MKTRLIENKNSTDLVLFLTGWGCDDNKFKNLTSSSNLLLCWDYSSLDLNFDFSKYKNINLLAYSAGVFIASLLQDKLPKFNKKIAVNGNPLMLDKRFGIPDNVTDLILKLNADNALDFIFKYLVYDEIDFKNFLSTQAYRSFESSIQELIDLKKHYQLQFKPMEFDLAILSDSDKVFNPQTQQEYFKNKFVLLKNAAHHTPFTRFTSTDDFFNISL